MPANASFNRSEADWINSYLKLRQHASSAEIYKLWSAIGILSAAAERRLVVKVELGEVHLNMFIILVGSPGAGKSQSIDPARRMMKEAGINVSPDDVSKASFLDILDSSQKRMGSSNEFASPLAIVAGEFGTFLPQYDYSFINVLNYLYDNPEEFVELKRGSSKSLTIMDPYVTILAGTQPSFLQSWLPEVAWQGGFTSRINFVYSGARVKPKFFERSTFDAALQENLANDLKGMMELEGKIVMAPEAFKALKAWYDADMPPVPTHPKLEHYNSRRMLHCLKLCGISSISHSNALIINEKDVSRAIDWLIQTETTMPDIFRAMVGQSDHATLEELHRTVTELFARNDGKPVSRTRIMMFLQVRLPSEKIMGVFRTAMLSKVIVPAEDQDPENPMLFKPGMRPTKDFSDEAIFSSFDMEDTDATHGEETVSDWQ